MRKDAGNHGDTWPYSGDMSSRNIPLIGPFVEGFTKSFTLRDSREHRAAHGVVTSDQRVFRIGLDELNVTVHRGDDVDAVREVPSSTPPKYFIDDVEVDEATFYRERDGQKE